MPMAQKERVMRDFGRAIARFEEYIPGPDMGTNEACMVWLKEEAGRAIGLPADQGGIPDSEGRQHVQVQVSGLYVSMLLALRCHRATKPQTIRASKPPCDQVI